VSAYFQSSGPRSNAYSESKFTNWALYDPFIAEARSAYKRFDERLPSVPKFPRIIVLPPVSSDFIHPVNRAEVKNRLERMPFEHIAGLRAVFLLAGTRKQQRSWASSLGCYGIYSRACVFLCAHLFELGRHNCDSIRDFYLDDVLVHEIAHHIDRHRHVAYDTKENFAHAFVQQQSNQKVGTNILKPLEVLPLKPTDTLAVD
jgi:hypothetical protein